MGYLLDTVAIIRHFTDSNKIGKQAKLILDNFIENHDNLYISTISLMEILYLSEKHRIDIDLTDTLNAIKSSGLYSIVDLSPDIIIVAQSLDFYELHDRMILATAKWLDVPIISSDSKFDNVNDIIKIWN